MYSDKLQNGLVSVLNLAAYPPRIFLLSMKMYISFVQTSVLLQSTQRYSKWSKVVQNPKTSVNCRVKSQESIGAVRLVVRRATFSFVDHKKQNDHTYTSDLSGIPRSLIYSKCVLMPYILRSIMGILLVVGVKVFETSTLMQLHRCCQDHKTRREKCNIHRAYWS